MLRDYFRKVNFRTISAMIAGVVITALGISIFKQSRLGNDAISAFNMRAAELVGLSLGTWSLISNGVLFIIEILWGRKYIGIGTFFNAICVGYIVTFFYEHIVRIFGTPETLPEKLIWVIVGVIVTSFGCALYQTADLGVAPYDYLAIGLHNRTKVHYFACRIFTDATSALICWLFGGLVGLGTIVCSLFLGPFVQFFTRTAAIKWVGIDPSEANITV